MSTSHPIIAVTGSSGAGTSTARVAFEHIFFRLGLNAAFVNGDAFHVYDRMAMEEAVVNATIRGETLSRFGPGANHLDRLQSLFAEYAERGTGTIRHYLHDAIEAQHFGQRPGTFTPWEQLPRETDILMYEGLHGGAITDRVNIAQHVDLMVGVVPTINLEWIQKIRRDTVERGYSRDTVARSILRRMPDYVRYITPQFSRTDINFQRVPLVDTSNPFIARDIPTADESMVVIRLRKFDDWPVEFPRLLDVVDDAFMPRSDTIVVPGAKMRLAIETTIQPMLEVIMDRRASSRPAVS